MGDGVIGTFFTRNLPILRCKVQSQADEAIFLVISNGVEGLMPPMNENFNVRERWDLVNFIRNVGDMSTTCLPDMEMWS